MEFINKNPFYILNVHSRDSKSKILDAAYNMVLDDGERECIYENAENILINPRKRISAEIRWFCGIDYNELNKIISCIQVDFVDILDIGHMNNIHKLLLLLEKHDIHNSLDVDSMVDYIIEFDKYYNTLNYSDVIDNINNDRKIAGITTIENISLIKDEIKIFEEDIFTFIKKISDEFDSQKYLHSINKMLENYKTSNQIGIIIEKFSVKFQTIIKKEIINMKEEIILISNDLKSFYAIYLNVNELKKILAICVGIIEQLKFFSKFERRMSIEESLNNVIRLRDAATRIYDYSNPEQALEILKVFYTILDKLRI
jgi:hypothetical protein